MEDGKKSRRTVALSALRAKRLGRIAQTFEVSQELREADESIAVRVDIGEIVGQLSIHSRVGAADLLVAISAERSKCVRVRFGFLHLRLDCGTGGSAECECGHSDRADQLVRHRCPPSWFLLRRTGHRNETMIAASA